jgi:hypothetical protein
VWAFSDESERAAVTLMAVVMVDPAGIGDARAVMRGLLLAGQRRVHTSDESHRRRHLILDTVAGIEGLNAVVLRLRRTLGVDRVAARQATLEAAVTVVVKAKASSWTLDDMHPAERARDRNIIGHALRRADPAVPVVFDHRRSHSEPLLWAADALCWAVGIGGDWRRRVEPVVTVVDIGP